jgi:CRISPR-associated endonuclease Csn1
MNKTLCLAGVNQKKANRTPHEVFGPHTAALNRGRIRPWDQILAAVKRFPGEAGRVKLERFQMESIESVEDFAERQFNDSAFASKEAKRYLGLLYGGEAASRVTAGKGRLTAILRTHWGLRKSRDDHRHHAVDAIVTAMLSRSWVKKITDACLRARHLGRNDIDQIEKPWGSFREDVGRVIEKIIVSHRVQRKVRGPLHEDTNYGEPATDESGKVVSHVRKPLSKLSSKEVKLIVDDAIRKLVEQKMNELGQQVPKKAFALPENHPFLIARKDGRRIPIHRVRIRVRAKTTPIGTGDRLRHVKTGENHHVEVFDVSDARRPRWEGRLVTRMEALARANAKPKKPVIDRRHPRGGRFLFSLAQGESVRMTHDRGSPEFFRVTVISKTEGKQEKPNGDVITLEFRRNSDAIPDTRARKMEGVRVRKTPNTLMKSGAIKVSIDPVGNWQEAHD